MSDAQLANYLASRDPQAEPGTFTNLAGFGKAWREVRAEILVAHGMSADAPNVRLASGCIVMDTQIGGRWVPFTDNGPDMRDRVRLGGTFRLRRAGAPHQYAGGA